jgi:hypothetical protein
LGPRRAATCGFSARPSRARWAKKPRGGEAVVAPRSQERAEIGGFEFGEGGQIGRPAQMLGEEFQERAQIARVAVERVAGSAAFVGEAVEPGGRGRFGVFARDETGC